MNKKLKLHNINFNDNLYSHHWKLNLGKLLVLFTLASKTFCIDIQYSVVPSVQADV